MGDERELLTARLRLRPWRAQDAPAMAAINRDPEVARFLNRPTDERAVDAFFGIATEHWATHGFGFYAVEVTDGSGPGGLIGFVGVAYPAFLPALAHRPELGWRLARHAWGRGLASEAAAAARDDALGRLGLGSLISVIRPGNVRSQRVAAKLGMSIEGQIRNPVLDIDVDIWSLEARAGTASEVDATAASSATGRGGRATAEEHAAGVGGVADPLLEPAEHLECNRSPLGDAH